MAAGTNWKRPWEEDADGSSDHSTSVIPHSGRSSVSSQHPATSESQHGAAGTPQAPLPPPVRGGDSFTSINAGQHTILGIRDSNQADSQPRYQASLTASHKRRRTSVNALDLSGPPTILYQLKGIPSQGRIPISVKCRLLLCSRFARWTRRRAQVPWSEIVPRIGWFGDL